MSYFDLVFQRRLRDGGETIQEQLQTQRERAFEHQLAHSVYATTINFEGKIHNVELAPYHQNTSETQMHLLTQKCVKLPGGTVLEIRDYRGETHKWMIFWLENMEASGYNRYRVLRMNHFIEWKDAAGAIQKSWVYIQGKKGEIKIDEIKTTSGHSTSAQPIYYEDLNKSSLIMPFTKTFDKDTYFEVKVNNEKLQCFRTTGIDLVSTPGVLYATIDAIYEFDKSPAPEKKEGDNDEDYYWLQGGDE